MNETYIKNVVEAALLAAGRPLPLNELAQLFDESAKPEPAVLRAALEALEADYGSRGIEVKETATGFRIQVRREMANEVSRLWPERPPRYSRALLETLALIAYRQPITRAEIEAVRGVAVNPNIIKTILERNWVRVVGTRDVPGRPELLGTTREFLDYFGLKSLEDLPPLAELKAMGEINLQLDLAKPAEAGSEGGSSEGGNVAVGADGAGSADGSAGGVGSAEGGADSAEGSATREAAVMENVVAAAVEAEATSPTEPSSDVVSTSLDVGGTYASPVASEPFGDAARELANEAVASSETTEAASVASSDEATVASASPLEVIVEPDVTLDTVAHVEIESDPGDVTVEVEALSFIESQLQASIEADEPTTERAGSAAEAAEPAADVTHDTAIETGEFEFAELGMTRASGSVIEAEFEQDDLAVSPSEEDAADDEEDQSAGPKTKSGLVAAPRGNDD